METPDFVLIAYQESLLIFLPEEIEKAKRRGQSVIRNRLRVYARQGLDDLSCSQMEEVSHE
jgi:hypothetical protein